MRAALPLALLLLAAARGSRAAPDAGPRCPPRAACEARYNVTDDYFYYVEGKELVVSYMVLDFFKLTCPENVTLDSESLPRFEPPVTVARVLLKECALPAAGLRAALAALGVRPRDELRALGLPPPAPAAAHLRGLPVRVLELAAAPAAALQADPDFLAPLPALLDLRLTGVQLSPAALLALPAGLKALSLEGAALAELPREALARLPALRRLAVVDARLTAAPDLAGAAALEELTLDAPVDGLTLGPALRDATLRNVRGAELRGPRCALERLMVVRAARLPAAGWAARCPRLAELRLFAVARGALAAGALRGAAALRRLEVRRSLPLALPDDLLADAPALRILDLSSNGLRNLSSNLFSATLHLEELNLSANSLKAETLVALAPFKSLQRLYLSDNPLGDMCNSTSRYLSNDLSPLREMRALRVLELSKSQIPRVCRDWRVMLRSLQSLNLRNNKIKKLGYEDLQWERAEASEVDLRDNPITTVHYTRDDYERSLSTTASPSLTLLMNTKLTCDCTLYEFARALRERPQHAAPALAALRCAARDERLRAVPLDALRCAVPPHACAPRCACELRGAAPVLRCAAAGLTTLPRAPLLPPPQEIHVAGNNISTLSVADLPPELVLLDLSDNLISELDVETAKALFAGSRRVRLAGNPLACGCAQRAALGVLQAHAAQLDAAACADGRALLALPPAALCARSPLPAAAAALGALALALAALAVLCLARPAGRQRIKRFLFERNLCLRWLLRQRDDDEEDEERIYDAFVSFSHHDEAFVEKLVERLESGPRPRRLCVHYRDWVPGEWIPTQISESVRRSRRTLVVLSAHFLRSTWARAEFREAHAAALRDARPRLVVLLLEPPPPALLDAELRAFLDHNTYLRWGDPWFWDKLLHALPPAPAPRASAAPPAPDPAPAPRAAPPAPAAAPAAA